MEAMHTRQSGELSSVAPTPPRGTRRKRRSSASLENSSFSQDIEPTSTQTSSQTTRRKRTKRTTVTSSQQLEVQLSQPTHQDAIPMASQPTVEDHEAAETIEVVPQNSASRSKHVRFSNPGLSIHVEQPPTPPDTISPDTPNMNITGLTPAVQRTSLSPHPQTSIRQRTSHGALPQVLRGSPDGSVVAELQFSPLREVLDERARRRLRRSHLSEEINDIDEHNKEDAKTRQELQELKKLVQEKNNRMKDLELELENQRQLGINISEEGQNFNERLQEELERLRQEVAEHKRAGSFLSDDGLSMVGDHDDPTMNGAEYNDHDMTLVDPEDIGITHEILPPVSFDKTPTPVILPDPTHEAEVQRFEQLTTSLNHDLAAARAALQILATELQTLGFSGLDAGTDIILANMRAAFRDARSQLHEVMPQAETDKLKNQQFLKALVDNIRNLLAQVGEQTQTIQRSKEMETVLKQQHSGLLDKLAETEQRKQVLQKQWNKLDHLADQRDKKIVELEDVLTATKEDRDNFENMAADYEADIQGLKGDVEMRDQDNDKLQTAINTYRTDLEKTETLLHKVEEQYKQHVADMEKEHAAAVMDLEDRVDQETAARNAAEADAAAKAKTIEVLENELDRANADIDELKAALADSQEELATQRSQREMAELEIAEKTGYITGLELRIESAEANVDSLSGQLEHVRALADSERRQREAAEAELDDRNNDVEILDNRLKQAGKESNELKSKLFEAQQRREKEVADLTAAAAEREDNLASELDEERAARAAADQRIEELNDVVADLEDKIREVEDAVDKMLAEKDEVLADRDGRIDELESLLKEQGERHQQFAEEKGRDIQALQDQVATLTANLEEHGAVIAELEADAIDNAQKAQNTIAEKDEAIEELNDDLAAKKQEYNALENLKLSLEQRIEDEAAAFLEAEAAHNDAITALNASLNARDKEIGKLLLAQQAAEQRYTDIVTRKDEKIESLEHLADGRLDDVNDLNAEVENLKDKLGESVRKGREAVEKMNKKMAAILADGQHEEAKLIEHGEKMMQDVEPVKVVKEPVSMLDGAAEMEPPARRSKRVSKKKTQVMKASQNSSRDSGIGLEKSSDEEDADAMLDGVAEYA